MACAITSGFTLDCRDSMGGVKEVYLIAVADITSFATGSEENGSIFYAHTLEMQFNKMQAAVRNQVKLLGANRCVAVVKDRNGTATMWGATMGLSLTGGSGGSGKAHGDFNGGRVTLSGAEPEPYFEVNSTVYAALTTPG
jgi:hypothetical protein